MGNKNDIEELEAKKHERVRVTFENKRDKIGMKVTQNAEPFFIEDYVQHVALDIVESYSKIERGEKKRDETNIDLQIQVLSSLSEAIRSLSVLLYY